MMLVYLSLTGNVENFVERVGMKSVKLDHSNPFIEVNEDFILVTPTYNDDLTDTVSDFVDNGNNLNHLIGFVGSGNRNFDQSFCFSAKDLSNKYSKPLIFTFEFSGTDYDIIEFKKEVEKVEIAGTKQKG
ncbi:class Ib ribonucleoside-diphosphate reductase assembly flavoprotein NrdI [Bacillus velezensis]|uniref:class Ib ribonucleoside-diphosphate reductase assembly flavoprotein NrdI n=1 Tax=Bacillus velezensis TaxID=492670 RepID=UPI0018C53929|nr:class Ib ribonucleoside-diphosphate reductase assembly flavoprotein NrdI [Bacillus velezensis]QPK89883.1 class Ib ribonucleoside-diphosphate reductase assembly flavoprotein NrdI [Bacillus velezensis]